MKEWKRPLPSCEFSAPDTLLSPLLPSATLPGVGAGALLAEISGSAAPEEGEEARGWSTLDAGTASSVGGGLRCVSSLFRRSSRKRCRDCTLLCSDFSLFVSTCMHTLQKDFNCFGVFYSKFKGLESAATSPCLVPPACRHYRRNSNGFWVCSSRLKGFAVPHASPGSTAHSHGQNDTKREAARSDCHSNPNWPISMSLICPEHCRCA